MRRNPSGFQAWGDFYENNQFLRSADARDAGLSREWLSQAARLGEIVKVLPGLYRKATAHRPNPPSCHAYADDGAQPARRVAR
jgi:hypothetical protein